MMIPLSAPHAAALPIQEPVSVSVPADGFGLFNLLDGGFMIYPLLTCAAFVVLLGGWTALRLFGERARPEPRVKAALDGILFWGTFAVVLGVLGTVVGVMVAARAVELAGEVHPSLAWGGIRVALITTVVGVLILASAALIWFPLRLRYGALQARAL